MTSAFPFTRSFLENAVQTLKNTVLKADMNRLEDLRKTIIAKYEAWAEEKLKGCPQFVRRFDSSIYFQYYEKDSQGYPQERTLEIECDDKVPIVKDNETQYGRSLCPKELSEDCMEYLRLKTKLDQIRVSGGYSEERRIRSYNGQGLAYETVSGDDGVEFERPRYRLYGLPAYRDQLSALVPKYEQSVRDSVHELITGKKPEVRKEPSEPVQLEFQF